MSTNTNTIRIITSEDDGYDITVFWREGREIRPETRYQPAEYADDYILFVEDEQGKRLTDEQIAALGMSDEQLMTRNEWHLAR